MKHKIISKEQFTLMGIAARTNNQSEMSGNGKIPALWAKFYSENIPGKLENIRTSEEIVVAYTEFETDETGEYTIVIGQQVKENSEIIPGLVKKKISASQYLEIPTETGNIQTIVVEAWQKIWKDQPLKPKRKYAADLEVYGAEAQDPNHAKVNIYLSIRDET